MQKKLILIKILLFFFWYCSTPSSNDDIDEEIIPKVIASGPGGPAYIAGNIRDFIYMDKPVPNTHLYLMNHWDYSDTIIHVFIKSTDADFLITELPLGTFDLITMHDQYLCSKIGKLKLTANGNSFNNPYSNGFFIDSTLYITNGADSVGRDGGPLMGLLGYGPALGVYFKYESQDSISLNIVKEAGCDTFYVYTYDDPVFDPYENDVYYIICISSKVVSDKLVYFNWNTHVNIASPMYEVVQP